MFAKYNQSRQRSATHCAATRQLRMYAGIAFAAGNLYTGDFAMDGTVGYAQFGQPYTYSARPAALKLKYAADDRPDRPGQANDAPASVSAGIDKARIFVCIVEWNATAIAVQSGTSRWMQNDVLGPGNRIRA